MIKYILFGFLLPIGLIGFLFFWLSKIFSIIHHVLHLNFHTAKRVFLSSWLQYDIEIDDLV